MLQKHPSMTSPNKHSSKETPPLAFNSFEQGHISLTLFSVGRCLHLITNSGITPRGDTPNPRYQC